MAYKTLYRTYRPMTFEEVAGQKQIVKTLRNALNTNKISHAYLFSGPRGTGKTTMAKLFAKALNCEEGIGQQCNQCSNCLVINNGGHPDVIEIDAASNNGVEEVRDLIDKVKYSPIKGRYKVYIIDEVHMMTSGAFNALLKTLEEPPSHVVFILATTEPHKVIPTILSRCQRYDFTKVSDNDIKERLICILKQENVLYDEKALDLIIKLADGGVRDALSMLDQVLAYSGNKLQEQDVLDIFALASISVKIDLLKSICEGNTALVLKKMDEFIAHGTDIRRLTGDLLDILKDVLIFESTSNNSLLLKLNENEVRELCKYIGKKQCLEMIEILLQGQNDFKIVSNARTLFEIILLKLSILNSKDNLAEGKYKSTEPIIENENKGKEESKQKVEIKEKDNVVPVPMPLFKDDLEPIEVENDEQYFVSDDDLIKIMIKGNKEGKKKLISKWQSIAINLDQKIVKLGLLLKEGRPYIVSNNILILEYDLPTMCKKINIKNKQYLYLSIVNQLDATIRFVYALPRIKTIEVVKKYRDLSTIGKLPTANKVSINLEEIMK